MAKEREDWWCFGKIQSAGGESISREGNSQIEGINAKKKRFEKKNSQNWV